MLPLPADVYSTRARSSSIIGDDDTDEPQYTYSTQIADQALHRLGRSPPAAAVPISTVITPPPNPAACTSAYSARNSPILESSDGRHRTLSPSLARPSLEERMSPAGIFGLGAGTGALLLTLHFKVCDLALSLSPLNNLDKQKDILNEIRDDLDSLEERELRETALALENGAEEFFLSDHSDAQERIESHKMLRSRHDDVVGEINILIGSLRKAGWTKWSLDYIGGLSQRIQKLTDAVDVLYSDTCRSSAAYSERWKANKQLLQEKHRRLKQAIEGNELMKMLPPDDFELDPIM